MTHILRHFTIRLWTSLLLAGLLVIIGFPLFGEQPGLFLAFWTALAAFLLLFFLAGWLGNTFGMRWINILMREAGIWERAGNSRQSEKIFSKALSIFDSFLISPVARETHSRELSSRMARFYLAQMELDPKADAFIVAYLHTNPGDVEVSDMWLEKSGGRKSLSGNHDELAFKLSDAQPENKALQRLLAHACLATERSDYAALRIYQRIIEDAAPGDRNIMDEIAWRFYHDRRTDRWAMQAYLNAFKADRKKTRLLKGIAACAERATVNDRTSRDYQEATKLLSRLDEGILAKMRAGFTPPPAKATSAPVKKERLVTVVQALRASLFTLSTTIVSAGRTTIRAYTALYQRLKTHRLTQPVLKWATIGLAGFALAVLVINTTGHLISTNEAVPPPKPESPPLIEVTDPFTLQVAAYLKVEHAEKFVTTLKSMGEDAYYTEAKSTKSKWFQVRISHFPSKDAARAHGESLKAKGIIDDYYVANYQRP